jgi:hypothetical protein
MLAERPARAQRLDANCWHDLFAVIMEAYLHGTSTREGR